VNSQAQSVIKYYVICNRLKDTIRTGWQQWQVKRERVESVAEHIYGTQMLALSMASEYRYDIDLQKVIFMLAVHEIGECVIGDFTPYQITREEKKRREHAAVREILSGLASGEMIEQLFLEFDEGETPEARFAFQCDKLECDLQCRLYDEENCVDLNKTDYSELIHNPKGREFLASGGSWSDLWISNDLQRIPYDEHFREVIDYALTHPMREGSYEQNLNNQK